MLPSSQPTPDLLANLAHMRIKTNMGVMAKNTKHGIVTMYALLAPGVLPDAMLGNIVVQGNRCAGFSESKNNKTNALNEGRWKEAILTGDAPREGSSHIS